MKSKPHKRKAESEAEPEPIDVSPEPQQASPQEDSNPLIPSILHRREDELPAEEQGKLARLDPLRKYLLEISQYEPLTPEEEHRLGVLYREEGDQQAGLRLVTANLKLVVKIAMLYRRVYANVLDLIQEGNIGLLEAVKRFDPYKGTRLPTYAVWWIKAYIIKFILDNFRIVRVGTTNERRRLLFNLRKEKEKLRLQGIEPTPQLLAKRLNVSTDEVRAVQPTIESTDLSLDSYVGDDESLRYMDTLTAAGELIDEKLARGELQALFNEKIREFADGLNERERIILFDRLMSENPKTLQEIADQYGVTREAIRLNEKSLFKRIQTYMRDALKEVTDVEFNLIG